MENNMSFYADVVIQRYNLNNRDSLNHQDIAVLSSKVSTKLAVIEVEKFTKAELEWLISPCFLANDKDPTLNVLKSMSVDQNERQVGSRNDKISKVHRVFTPSDIQTLLSAYAENSYPSSAEVNDLTSITKLSFKQIRKWFEKERYRRRLRDGTSVMPPASAHPAWAVEILSKYFSKNNYPSRQDVIGLAGTTKL